MNTNACFEKISKYAEDEGVILPYRKTAGSAGYDFYCAEDTIIPPFTELVEDALLEEVKNSQVNGIYENAEEWAKDNYPYTLERVAKVTKEYNAKVALVPTGIKCKLPEGYYLQLSVRSSLPLKHWLILGNGVGIIDADYYNNLDNEGHIYFQIINLLPVPIKIQKGECFGQGIILPYGVMPNDTTEAERKGGFGSTNA